MLVHFYTTCHMYYDNVKLEIHHILAVDDLHISISTTTLSSTILGHADKVALKKAIILFILNRWKLSGHTLYRFLIHKTTIPKPSKYFNFMYVYTHE